MKLISFHGAHPDDLNIDVLTGSCQFRVNYHRLVGPSALGQLEVLDEARVCFCPHTRQNVGDCCRTERATPPLSHSCKPASRS